MSVAEKLLLNINLGGFMEELCKSDGEMSESFWALLNTVGSELYCSSMIGWISIEDVDFRNGVVYKVELN